MCKVATFSQVFVHLLYLKKLLILVQNGTFNLSQIGTPPAYNTPLNVAGQVKLILFV